MNNDVRGEMIVVLGNEAIEPDEQVVILATAAKFLNNVQYIQEIKDKIDVFFYEDANFWVELPKIISVIVDIIKHVLNNSEIPKIHMKYILYTVIYHYLNEYQSIVLNKINQGDLRIGLLNLLSILLLKPKNIKVMKQSLFNILINCICGDENIRL